VKSLRDSSVEVLAVFCIARAKLLEIWTGTSCALHGVVDADELRARVKRFAIRVVKYVQTLPKAMEDGAGQQSGSPIDS